MRAVSDAAAMNQTQVKPEPLTNFPSETDAPRSHPYVSPAAQAAVVNSEAAQITPTNLATKEAPKRTATPTAAEDGPRKRFRTVS